MARRVLWLDENLRARSNLLWPGFSSGIDALRNEMSTMDIVECANVPDFVSWLTDYDRLRQGVTGVQKWQDGDELSGIIVDIMIAGTTKIRFPEVCLEDRKIRFRENGVRLDDRIETVTEMEVGLVLAEHFLANLSNLDHVPLIFGSIIEETDLVKGVQNSIRKARAISGKDGVSFVSKGGAGDFISEISGLITGAK